MFNEAFWFFYLIGIAGTVRDLAFLLSFITGAGVLLSVLCTLTFSDEEEWRVAWLRAFRGFLALFIVVTIFSIITPTQQSLYAGGAQYAVQAVELDDTIMAFKDIIDAKIADLTPTEGETE